MMQPGVGVGPPIVQANDQQQWMIMQQPVQQVMHQVEQPHHTMNHHHHHVPQSYEEVRTLWVGDLQYWMDENYLRGCFLHTGEVISVKVIRNKQTMVSEGYGFIEFSSHTTAEKILQTYNGTLMPQTDQAFRLNWASFGIGEKRSDSGPDFSIFVGDLGPDVTDYLLTETFRSHYPSIRGAKVIIDPNTGCSKGYGFVRFGDESERTRAMTEMNGAFCLSRPMRISTATPKKSLGFTQPYNQKAALSGAPYQSPSYGAPTPQLANDNDPNSTTIFVGGLDPNVSDDDLKHVFGQFGDLVYVKIPPGKGCGFVQFGYRPCAEEALQKLHGTVIGQQAVRLSWGRSYTNRQPAGWGQLQQDPNQWNTAYYGYDQGYEGYGYAPPAQDAGAYAYASYPSYGNYAQQTEAQAEAVTAAQAPEYREEEAFDPLAPADIDKMNAVYIAVHEPFLLGHNLWLRTSVEVQPA